MTNCNCKNTDELRIVRGNAFGVQINIEARKLDGTLVEDFDLSQANATLKVIHYDQKTEKSFVVAGNSAIISFDNTLTLGRYGFEMYGTFNDSPWRWCVQNVFQIVETNEKANIPTWTFLTDDTYTMDGSMTLMSGEVYQSDWDETNIYSPAYIKNKPDVVLHPEFNQTVERIDHDIDAEELARQQADTTLQGNIDAEETRAKAAEKQNADDIDAIEEKIPAQASAQNQLADKQFVNSSISTATATYRGAYNLVSDLELTTDATEQEVSAALATKMTALGITPDNNDYCFVQVPTADATPTEIARVDRYKFNGTAWAFEFSLNNSGFTAAQWAALNSGITSGLVTKLSDLPTNSELTTLLGGKEDNSNKVTSLSAESTDTQYPSAKCVYDLHKANADDIDDIEALIPAQATPQNQLADKQYVDDGISTASATYRGAYNLVSDLELTTAATEQQIAAALATKMTALGITPDNNDYCFVQVPTADATPTEIARVDRYKFNGTAWAFEFSLNNSGFTAAQWAALNSGITSGLVTKLSDLPTNSELTTLLGGKEDNSNKVTSLSAESTDTQYPSAKCVYDLHKANADDIDAIEEKIPSDASSSNKMATASDITNLSDSIAAILLLIPSAASSLNQLADKAFVNSSIATNTATYRGSYNLVSDLSLTISATEQQIAAALATKMTALSITPDNNDYCFVQVPTADATPTEISRIDRYKYNGTAWLYEYSLNNSSFTSAQWAAINSGITSALVAKLSALPTNAELTTALGVLTDGIAAINAKIPSAATSSNKLVDNTAMQSYVAQIVNALDATFNITSSDGHVTVQITQTNGVITALAITTSDIASAAALNLLSGRVTTAEGNISTNATDIANLQQLYNNLQQSDPIIIEPADTWPVANPSTHDIYRVIDRVNTPTQYYSDYMWNGTTMVLMAQYDNAIDDEPTPGSNNLVKSGGVAANIVYDISRAHASGSTLATYADLAAALDTNGANIPAEIRRGGMSVKFVCSSDNKYVQYRLMSDSWSIDTNDWSFCGDSVYVENPEWIYVLLDAEKRILAGLKSDGSVEWSIGVPTPIKTYIDNAITEIKNGTEGTDIDGINKIITFLSDFSTSDTLKNLLDTKVDKEEGKSLIDAEYAEGVHYVENPEFVNVWLDSKDKILFGVKSDGTMYFGAGVPQQAIDYINEKIAELSLDEYEDIVTFLGDLIEGDKTLQELLNEKVDKEEGKSLIDAEYASSIQFIENPEFAGVWLDAENKVLFGVQTDGNFLFGCGVPRQVKEYIEQKIEELSLDEYESIVSFIGEYLGSTDLATLLGQKVDKEEGKSLINEDVANSIHYEENPEFINVELDANGRIIKATKNDGTEYFGVGIDIAGISTEFVIENPEFLGVFLDGQNRVLMGFQKNGNVYYGIGVPKQIKDYIDKAITSIQTFLDGFEDGTTLLEYLNTTYGEYVKNPEFMSVELDAGNRIIGGRKSGGKKFEKIGLETPNISVDGVSTETVDDPEDRIDVGLDGNKKVLHYHDKDGVLHENVGIETKKLHLDEQGMTEFQQDLKNTGFKPRQISTPYNLPKYGTVNIKRETFYLSAEGWDSYADDVELRQLYADTDANAESYVTISRFYTTNNVPLLFFAASKVNGLVGTASVTKVNGICYYTDTLAYNNNTNIYSVLEHSMVATVAEEPAEQKSVNVEVAVKEVTDVPPYNAWAVNKKDEHHCIADVNFGHYLTKNNAAIGVKYQGSSTLKKRKRNLRFTFYKNNTFAKKNKIKIGELVRLSGYNLKANWSDNTRTKELILYRLILDVWKNRPITDRFPWDKQFGYFTGATGIINGFNIRTNIGGTFYGLHTFGLKKDEKNYMLDGTDESGIFVCGARRDATCWTTSTAADWEDEMMDDMSQDTADALNVFLSFINNRLYKGSDNSEYLNTALTYFVGNTAYTYNDVTVEDGKVVLASDTSVEIDNIYVTSTLSDGQPVGSSVSAELIPFDRENAPERMDILGWIDYFICMQTAEMWDSICRNMILFSQSDKKKFYPYFYDLDLSLQNNYDDDIFDLAYNTVDGVKVMNDMSLWSNLKDMYWDEIINRYTELRKTVLTIDNIKAIYHDVTDDVPEADYIAEKNRWSVVVSKTAFTDIISMLDKRLVWLDNEYFI